MGEDAKNERTQEVQKKMKQWEAENADEMNSLNKVQSPFPRRRSRNDHESTASSHDEECDDDDDEDDKKDADSSAKAAAKKPRTVKKETNLHRSKSRTNISEDVDLFVGSRFAPPPSRRHSKDNLKDKDIPEPKPASCLRNLLCCQCDGRVFLFI